MDAHEYKNHELVWHVLENDQAWFADHPDRQYHARPALWGEGTATHLKRRVGQIGHNWFVVRRDLEYAAFSPVVQPIDDEEICRLLFKAHVGLRPPKRQYLDKALLRWIAVLQQMPQSEECDLALSRLTGASCARPNVRKTGGAEGKVLAATLWQD